MFCMPQTVATFCCILFGVVCAAFCRIKIVKTRLHEKDKVIS